MKKLVFALVIGVVVIASMVSCDRVTAPYIIQTELDTTLYPGNFIDYSEPTFDQNTNTLKNVLIEDWTGHQCTFCPAAADVAAQLETDNPGRVFVATIHAGADNDGISAFQETNSSGAFTTDFTTVEGTEMAASFFSQSVGFNANPKGCINRLDEGGLFFLNSPDWSDKVDEGMASALDVNLQAKSNYFPSTNGVYLHVETEFINELEGEYNIVVYAIENKVVDWQKVFGTGDVPDYEHHNVHIGNVFNETWGRSVGSGSIAAGTKVVTDFSYKVPDHLDNTKMHFIIYVYDKETYEVMQVIDHHF